MDITSGMFTGRVAVITRSIGDFELDCTVREEHTSSLRLTKNPVESGADIADHAILEPKSLTITGIVVGYEPPQPIKHLTGLDTDLMSEYPLPLELSASLGQAQSMLSSYLSIGAAVQEKAAKVLAPWYPDSVNTSTDTSSTLDRVGRAYEGLLALQKKGEPIIVQTGIRLYTNMIITNISTTQDKPGSAEFTLTVEEIFIVENQTAQGLHPDLKGQPKKANKGRTQPTEKGSKSSMVKELREMIR